jgi:hypothetical protein
VIQVLDAPGGADEIFYDALSGRTYVAGTTGALAIYHQDDPDHCRLLGLVPTGPDSKAGAWIPELKRYYAAVPTYITKPLTPMRSTTSDWIAQETHLVVLEAIP